MSLGKSGHPLTALPTVKAAVPVTISGFFLASGSGPRPTPGASQTLRLPSSRSKSHLGYFKYAPPCHLFVTTHTTLNRRGHAQLGGGQTPLGNSGRSPEQWGRGHAGHSKFIAGLEAWPGLCLESSVVQLMHKLYHLTGDTGLLTLTPTLF